MAIMNCIDRQSVIDIIQSYKTNTARSIENDMPIDHVVDMLADMIDDVANESTVQPEWISCKDRLPDKKTCVLTCSNNGTIWMNTYDPLAPTEWGIDHWAVAAWMPLPEPYRGETKEV